MVEATPRRNPPWAQDELILALDLYLRRRPQIPGDEDPEVIGLSEVLNALPIHTVRPDWEKFRNPNGVAMKLGNFAALDPTYPGRGLTAGGRRDAEVWDEFHQRPDELAALADTLRQLAADGSASVSPEEDEDEVEEGRIVFRQHRVYERDRSLRDKKKRSVIRATGRLACEVCGFDFSVTYGDELGENFIEVHHIIPLSEVGGFRKTGLADLAVLCCNCHRMIHRAKPWLRPEDLRRHLRV